MDKEIGEGGIGRRWPESFESHIGPYKAHYWLIYRPNLDIYWIIDGPTSYPSLSFNSKTF